MIITGPQFVKTNYEEKEIDQGYHCKNEVHEFWHKDNCVIYDLHQSVWVVLWKFEILVYVRET